VNQQSRRRADGVWWFYKVIYYTVGFTTDISVAIQNRTAPRGGVLNPTANKIFLPDTIKNQNQLVAFKKVKHIFLTVTIEYVMGNEKKQTSITWKFRPRVEKSSALWDKWMSVSITAGEVRNGRALEVC
jgi:hypothetical protein